MCAGSPKALMGRCGLSARRAWRVRLATNWNWCESRNCPGSQTCSACSRIRRARFGSAWNPRESCAGRTGTHFSSRPGMGCPSPRRGRFSRRANIFGRVAKRGWCGSLARRWRRWPRGARTGSNSNFSIVPTACPPTPAGAVTNRWRSSHRTASSGLRPTRGRYPCVRRRSPRRLTNRRRRSRKSVRNWTRSW